MLARRSLLILVVALAVVHEQCLCMRVRTMVSSQRQTQPRGEPDPQDDVPQLGNLSDMYAADEYLITGGQAQVWKGKDLRHGNRPVILKFPRALCESKYCKVGELPDETVEEVQNACNFAIAANARWKRLQQMRPGYKTIGNGFARCLRPISDNPHDIAVEVWSYDGDFTLGDTFFLTPFGSISLSTKRRILYEIQDLIATLSADVLSGPACCCSRQHPRSCKEKTSFWCPSGYKQENEACGKIVHHDIKFDNIVLNVGEDRLLHPVIIDFGAAAWCHSGEAPGYSRDWSPSWLASPSEVSNALCWSYDFYGLAIMELTTELLGKLPPSLLLIKIVGQKEHDEIEKAFQEIGADTELMSAAQEPVRDLVADMREMVLGSKDMQLYSFHTFEKKLREFFAWHLSTRVPENGLLINLPSSRRLEVRILPMLQGCFPLWMSGPGPEDMIMTTREDIRFLKFNVETAYARVQHSFSYPGTFESQFARYKKACEDLKIYPTETSKRCSWQGRAETLALHVAKTDAKALRQVFHGLSSKEAQMVANTIMPGGASILAAAVLTGSEATVQFLLDKGADPWLTGSTCQVSFEDHVGGMALLAASSRAKNAGMLKLLLKANLNIYRGKAADLLLSGHVSKTTGKACGTPLSVLAMTAQYGDEHMLRLVLKSLGLQNRDPASQIRVTQALQGLGCKSKPCSEPPLLVAAKEGNAENCRVLIEAGAQGGLPDKWGRSPLHLAVQSKSRLTVKEVLGAPGVKETINQKSSWGTPLHLAARLTDAGIAKLLLQFGADEMVQDQYGNTPLHVAAIARGSMDTFEILATNSAAQASINRDRLTPLLLLLEHAKALYRDNAKSLDDSKVWILLKYAHDEVLYAETQSGETALHIAVRKNRAITLGLLAKRIPVAYKGSNQHSALTTAVRYGYDTGVKILIQNFGASCNDRYLHYPLAMLPGFGFKQGWGSRRFSTAKIRDMWKSLVDLCGRESLQLQDKWGMNALGAQAYTGSLEVHHLVVNLHVDCNAVFLNSSDIAKFGGVTALHLVRKRINHLKTSPSNYPIKYEGVPYWSRCKGMNGTEGKRHACLLSDLEKTQTFLESQRCDGQDSEHVPVRQIYQF